jgi:hypothetical protein
MHVLLSGLNISFILFVVTIIFFKLRMLTIALRRTLQNLRSCSSLRAENHNNGSEYHIFSIIP